MEPKESGWLLFTGIVLDVKEDITILGTTDGSKYTAHLATCDTRITDDQIHVRLGSKMEIFDQNGRAVGGK